MDQGVEISRRLKMDKFPVPFPDITKPVQTGTTIMATEFNDGVVIGGDTRTTSGTIITHKVSDKITEITDSIYCARSGSLADTQALADIIKYYMDMYRYYIDTNPMVSVVAKQFQSLSYTWRDKIQAGLIVAGWDSVNCGQVYSIPMGGACVRQHVTISGSGSSYISGYIDAYYHNQMTKNECMNFTTNAISLAIARDGGSGGVIRLAVITKDGVERKVILGNHLPCFYDG
ncbi:proteasome subunit beta type-6-like [Saccoglossus kowalevskii]